MVEDSEGTGGHGVGDNTVPSTGGDDFPSVSGDPLCMLSTPYKGVSYKAHDKVTFQIFHKVWLYPMVIWFRSTNAHHIVTHGPKRKIITKLQMLKFILCHWGFIHCV